MEKEMIVYYQIGGHKMKTSVFADTPAIAEQKIRQKIEILKVEEVKKTNFTNSSNFNDIFGQFGQFGNMFGGRK